jgi:uncharacterized iron-regulated membrane protein
MRPLPDGSLSGALAKRETQEQHVSNRILSVTSMQQSPHSSTRSLRRVFDTTLVVGAALATVVAVSVVLGLFWWIAAGPSFVSPPQHRASVPLPAPPPAAPAAAQREARPAPRAPHAASAKQAPVAAAAPVPPAPVPAAPAAVAGEARPNPDAQKNRAIAQGLSRLGHDPDLQRRLAVPPDDPEE